MGQGTIYEELDSMFHYFQKHNPELFESSYQGTSSVWNKITATDTCYPGTVLPKSFNMSTNNGTMHITPNGTKHMHELLSSKNGLSHFKNSDPKLLTQFLLYNFDHALNTALSNGIKPNELAIAEGWEFKFNKRKDDLYPAVFHARYRGE